LRFGIEEREISREGFSTGLDYSTEFRDAYVPKDSREIVMYLILRAIECLLSSTKARIVTMRTFYRNLPPKALLKYGRICDLMKVKAYTISEDFHSEVTGRNYWIFKLEHA